ncbi:acyl transferase/acyl hydrolase/lysophospholipase [Annulohypoxylon nitens]|nr:acyl transferase/acyl hydrolase/lysophospholipase [Annulohypoxylon nitens]
MDGIPRVERTYNATEPQGLFDATIAIYSLEDTSAVFVHGPEGHPLFSWGEGDSDFGGENTLKALPRKLEVGHTLSFAYSLPITEDRPLSSAAISLLNELSHWYRDLNSPDELRLVFISQGLGGAVVKEALYQGSRSKLPSEKRIWRQCIGTVFLDMWHNLDSSSSIDFRFRTVRPATSSHNANPMRKVAEDGRRINQRYLELLDQMPPSLSILNESVLPSKFGNKSNLFTLPRKGKDQYFPITRTDSDWHEDLGQTSAEEENRKIVSSFKQWYLHFILRPIHYATVCTYGGQSEGLRLLSLDGGGVRGLSSLLILREILEKVAQHEFESGIRPKSRIAPPLRSIRPSRRNQHRWVSNERFTGSKTLFNTVNRLICIMLFRLRMDIYGAIEQYEHLAPEIFHQGFASVLGGNIAKSVFAKPWFKARPLEVGIKEIIRRRLPLEERKQRWGEISEARFLISNQPRAPSLRQGKTFVCACKSRNNEAIRIRSYEHDDAELSDCKIWEAARATSSAPFYFPPITIGSEKFVDGALAYNNPVEEVYKEAQSINPERKICCIISLGTGFTEQKPKKSILPVIGKGKKILKSVTNTENSHRSISDRAKASGIEYHRFDVNTGNDVIGLADYKRLSLLKYHTKKYLDDDYVQDRISDCAALLARTRPSRPRRQTASSTTTATRRVSKPPPTK